MQHKQLLLLLLLIPVMTMTGAEAQTMYVREIGGGQTSYPLNNLSKMTFSSGNLIVTQSGGGTDDYALADLRYINFTDLTVEIAEIVLSSAGDLQVYPNPANDMLNISIAAGEYTLTKIEIYSAEGRLVLQKDLVETDSILSLDISSLPSGLFFCRISTTGYNASLKFIKD